MVLAAGSGCGASIPADEHRRMLAEQRANYEQRLLDAEQARVVCRREAGRAEQAAVATVAGLEQRVRRLERAADRVGPGLRAPRGARAGALRAALQRILGSEADVSGGAGRAVGRIGVQAWFDSGSTKLRGSVAGALDRLAMFLAGRSDLSVSVRVARSEAFSTAEVVPAWREASERGVAIAGALQAQGVAPARLTLSVGGGGPEQRIVFVLQSNARRRRR